MKHFLIAVTVVFVFALPAWGQEEDSPELRRAIERVQAKDYKGALPALIAASASGERIANWYLGIVISNWFKRGLKNKEYKRKGFSFSEIVGLEALDEAVSLRTLVETFKNELLKQAIPELKRRGDAGNLDAMVNLASIYLELDEKKEGFLNDKALELLQRAAVAGSKYAITLVWAHFSTPCFLKSDKCELDKALHYGCMALRKGDKSVLKSFAIMSPGYVCPK